jgi:signal transduction histidine kinase
MRIFNNFYRIKKNDLKDDQGCGLGLAISKKIIELHGGSIYFRSQDEKNSLEVEFLVDANKTE